jgi:uncharacterized protein (TIGR00730 family)
MRRVCVFCGSSVGKARAYAAAARRLGTLLAMRGIGLVYGGGNVGLMGVLADAALASGGQVIGVIPHGLAVREVAHRGLTRLHVVESMHERKELMASLSDGFIALPGGLGTYEEFFEAVTWTQLGVHRKPSGLLDAGGFYAPLVRFLDAAVEDGFIKPEHRAAIVVDADADRLLDRLMEVELPDTPRWMGLDET